MDATTTAIDLQLKVPVGMALSSGVSGFDHQGAVTAIALMIVLAGSHRVEPGSQTEIRCAGKLLKGQGQELVHGSAFRGPPQDDAAVGAGALRETQDSGRHCH